MVKIKVLVLAAAFLVSAPVAEAHHFDKGRTPCAQKYVGKDRNKCYIKRAAEHFGQNPRFAIAVAWCESRLGARESNSYGLGHKGLYQFDPPTWRYAPWGVINGRQTSRYNARYSALNAMWYWKKGEFFRWASTLACARARS